MMFMSSLKVSWKRTLEQITLKTYKQAYWNWKICCMLLAYESYDLILKLLQNYKVSFIIMYFVVTKYNDTKINSKV